MYMGYIEYQLIYRSKNGTREVFSETRPFTDIAHLEALRDKQTIERLCHSYGADEVLIEGAYFNEDDQLEVYVG